MILLKKMIRKMTKKKVLTTNLEKMVKMLWKMELQLVKKSNQE